MLHRLSPLPYHSELNDNGEGHYQEDFQNVYRKIISVLSGQGFGLYRGGCCADRCTNKFCSLGYPFSLTFYYYRSIII